MMKYPFVKLPALRVLSLDGKAFGSSSLCVTAEASSLQNCGLPLGPQLVLTGETLGMLEPPRSTAPPSWWEEIHGDISPGRGSALEVGIRRGKRRGREGEGEGKRKAEGLCTSLGSRKTPAMPVLEIGGFPSTQLGLDPLLGIQPRLLVLPCWGFLSFPALELGDRFPLRTWDSGVRVSKPLLLPLAELQPPPGLTLRLSQQPAKSWALQPRPCVSFL